jgi:hypothetical protein
MNTTSQHSVLHADLRQIVHLAYFAWSMLRWMGQQLGN